jgi:hypothetical protein
LHTNWILSYIILYYVGNESFRVDAGLVKAENLQLSGTLDIGESVHIEDSLTIGSTFAMTPGGMTIDVSSHTGTLFELTSRQNSFEGSLMEIRASGNSSSMIKTVVDGMTTFQVLSSGHLSTRGIKMYSGGIDVMSGGIQVSICNDVF